MADKRMQFTWDPIALAAQLRNITRQGQVLMQHFVSHEPDPITFGAGERSMLGFEFFELMTRMMTDPVAVASAQIGLFYNVLVLLSQSVAAFAEKNHIFEKTHLFSMRRG